MSTGILGNDLQSLLGSPQMQGIAMGLLQASGPSPTPISFGQALGQGMQMGNQMQEQAYQRQLNQLMMELKMKDYELKMKDYERKSKQQEKQDKYFEKLGGNDQMAEAVRAGLISPEKYFESTMGNQPVWEQVNDPELGMGQINRKTGEFKPIKKSDTSENADRAARVKEDALVVVDRLLNNQKGVYANRGGISTLFPNVSDSSVNAEADLETLASMLTAENLGLLKGVLSDNDIRMLKDIGAGGLKGADEQVWKNLQTLKAKLGGGQQVGGWQIQEVQ